MQFNMDYDQILEDTAKKLALSVETYRGDKRDRSSSSGMLSTDLIIGNAGWVPGWHTCLGFEQSAKTTTVITSMHEALKTDIPIIQLWDYEKSFDANYARNFFNNELMNEKTFGVMDSKGKWLKKPRIRSYQEHVSEPFFNSIHKTLKVLPKKVKIQDNWFYQFDKTNENKKIVGDSYNKTLSTAMDKYLVEAENGRPQAFIVLDSYPAMLPEGMDDDSNSKAMAQQARMFSEQIKRIKGLIGAKNVILLGINQMRLKPAVMFGSPEYEPGGEALKLFSDTRIKHASCAVPQVYANFGEKIKGSNHIAEKSIGGSQTDVYSYITMDIIKNKVGGSPKGTRIHQRVWVSDEYGLARGLDPAFDCWQYLKLTSQLKGNLKKFTLNIKDNPLNKLQMDFHKFKGLIIGDSDIKKKICKSFGVTRNPMLRQHCFEQIQSGLAYELFAVGNEIDE